MARNWEAYRFVLADKKMQHGAKLVYFALWMHQNRRGFAWPKTPTLSAGTGISERAVRLGFRSLEALGVIRQAGKSRFGVIVWYLGEGGTPVPVEAEPHYRSHRNPSSAPSENNIIYEHVQGTNPHEPAREEDDTPMPKKPETAETLAILKDIHQHHLTVMSKALGREMAWRLTKGLKDKLKTRLETFTPDDLKLASTNLSKSPHHLGVNDRGTEYCDLIFLFHTDERVDKWLNIVQHKPTTGNGRMPDGRIKLAPDKAAEQLANMEASQKRRLAKSQAERAARQQKKG